MDQYKQSGPAIPPIADNKPSDSDSRLQARITMLEDEVAHLKRELGRSKQKMEQVIALVNRIASRG